MKITGLEIEGFGVWSGLRIEKFGDSLNVLYGPNEAGKTTLLQFIRSMLYGFSPERRRYFPPLHGGCPGGVIDLAGPHGRFQIGRYDHALADGAAGEQVTLTAPDGTRQGEHFMKVLLSNVDEPVFNNVFAVGLRELQELATLGDTEAANLLYSLSAGLDRVSLVEVLRELKTSRNRILDDAGKPCQVVQLLADREKIRAEIEELGTINHRYGRLAAQHDQLHREITQLEEEINRDEHLGRAMDLAVALRDRWDRRAALDEQLSAFGPAKVMPERAIERLDAVNARIERHRDRLEHLAGLREAAKREFAQLPVSESLWRQTARIEALTEQEPWVAQLSGQIAELKGEIGEFESALAAERDRLGLKSAPAALPAFSAKTLAPLRAPANLLGQCRRRLVEAQQAEAEAGQTADSLARQIESSLAARAERDLPGALDRAGGLVSQFRRRLQLDDRIEQLARYQVELEQRSRRLIDRQLLPVGVLIGLGAAFVVGVVLILTGLLMPYSLVGSAGWTLALLGLAGSGASAFAKWMLERSNVHQLDGCQKQLGMLQLQLQQAKDDREALDLQLPRGGGQLSSRLQAAEQELAALEELAPLDARRNAARQEAEAAARRAAEEAAQLRTARRGWRDALATAGLPREIGPKQLHRLVRYGDRFAESQRRLGQRREELARRQRELDSLAARIAQLAGEAGVSLGSTNPIEQLRQLAEAAAGQQTAAAARDAIRAQSRRIRAARLKHEEAVGALSHRRRKLLIEAGVKDEQEFRRRALEIARADVLRGQREAVAREIEAALGSQYTEAAIRQQLEGDRSGQLEARRDELRRRLAVMQAQLREMLETRGRLGEQLAALAADRQLPARLLDLAIVEKRLEEALCRWQVLAATCHILDSIRGTYERERQPETLQEASGYLDRLTQGRYRRVWTPLGEHSLRVDDAEGRWLPVESLSRGTREQLFLSLRLALASSYAKRGACLPLVLDDVLVNFDAERAGAAAAVLRDFAAAGHQLLIFTCHEHILKLFKSLHVPVSRLPDNAAPGGCAITMEHREDEKPKRQRAPRAPRRKAAPKPQESPPDETENAAKNSFDDDAHPEEDGRLDDLDEEGQGEDDSLWENEEGRRYDDLDDDSAAAA